MRQSISILFGVLTFGSSYSLRPSHPHEDSGQHHIAAFVADHSGGAVPDSHQLPSFPL